MLARALEQWALGCCRAAPWIVLAAVLLAVWGLDYARENLGVNTSTREMFSENLQWRRDHVR